MMRIDDGVVGSRGVVGRWKGAVLAAMLAGSLAAGANAQCAPQPQPPQDVPDAVHESGHARLTQNDVELDARQVHFAVRGSYCRLTAADCDVDANGAKASFACLRLGAEAPGAIGRDAVSYVKIGPVANADADQALSSVADLASWVQQDPQRFVPLVLLARDEVLFANGVPEAGRNKELAELRSALYRLQVGGDQELARFRASPAAAILASLQESSLPGLIKKIRFPFVVARRTVGGAEGTEVVVYVEPGANDNECFVWYFYLWSAGDQPPPIDIVLYRPGGAPAVRYRVPVGFYARIPLATLVSTPPDVMPPVRDWCLDGHVDIMAIAGIQRRSHADTVFRAQVEAAYRKAGVLSGQHPDVRPHSPISFAPYRTLELP